MYPIGEQLVFFVAPESSLVKKAGMIVNHASKTVEETKPVLIKTNKIQEDLKVTTAYSIPTNVSTSAQRAFVQGKPCVMDEIKKKQAKIIDTNF